jgi:membrane protein DedA with SNARE-associated domain
MVAALIWGIGLSLYAFQFGSDEISWVQWSAQLVGGILACLIVPLAWVRGTAWLASRMGAQRSHQ